MDNIDDVLEKLDAQICMVLAHSGLSFDEAMNWILAVIFSLASFHGITEEVLETKVQERLKGYGQILKDMDVACAEELKALREFHERT